MQRFDNEFHTWTELVELYPDKWVVVENAKLTKGGFIIEGELLAVGDITEIGDFVAECWNEGRKVEHDRTTDSGNVGVLEVEGLTIKVI